MWICIGINYFHKLELYRAHTPRAAGSIIGCRELELHACPLTTFTYILCQVMRMSTWWVVLIGVVNKMQYLRRSWTLPNDSKHNEANFSTISTDMLYLRVAQTPGRFSDLAIFDDSDYFTPCACARDNYGLLPVS